MEQIDFLRDFLIVYSVAGIVVYLFARFRLPAIVGLLIAGMIIGPYGLSLLDDLGRVEELAEIGVVLLLFTVGLEFTRERLAGAGHLLGAGLMQLAIAIAGGALFTLADAAFWGQAIFAGFLVAHTSTTVLLKLLMERGEMETPHARVSLAISIVQDLCVVWMVVLVPVLAGGKMDSQRLISTLAMGILAVAAVLVIARYVVPRLMSHVVGLRSRELFLIQIVVICMGTAWLTAQAGLSLALGAFLAGIALAESEYSHQTLAEAVPFRDVFVSLFFISIGMLFDVHFVLRHPLGVAGIVVGVVALKFVSGAIPTLLVGYSWRTALLVGAGMAQIGEFAFVLSQPGRAAGLLPDEAFQALLAAAILTMAISPFLVSAAPRLIDWVEWLPRFSPHLNNAVTDEKADDDRFVDHAIVVGFGVNGRNLVRAFRNARIPFVVLELNPVRVQLAREAEAPVVFGDCTRPNILQLIGVERARLIVIAISDPLSARRTVQIARHLNPKLQIIVRTRYLKEMEGLQNAGANEIIAEEFESSIVILSRAMEHYKIGSDVIARIVAATREDYDGRFREFDA